MRRAHAQSLALVVVRRHGRRGPLCRQSAHLLARRQSRRRMCGAQAAAPGRRSQDRAADRMHSGRPGEIDALAGASRHRAARNWPNWPQLRIKPTPQGPMGPTPLWLRQRPFRLSFLPPAAHRLRRCRTTAPITTGRRSAARAPMCMPAPPSRLRSPPSTRSASSSAFSATRMVGCSCRTRKAGRAAGST